MSQKVLCPRLHALIVSVLEELGIDAEEQGAMADEPSLTRAKLIQAFDHLKRHVVCREADFVGPPRGTRRMGSLPINATNQVGNGGIS